jgi:Dyp-type peroxidase family
MSIQEGVYYQSGTRPGSCFSIMFLRVRAGATASAVDSSLAGLWSVYSLLRAGRISDLAGVQLPSSGLTILMGYGPKAFEISGARQAPPQDLGPEHQFKSPAPSGGGPLLAGSGLAYVDGLARNPATEEIVVQAIAETPLAANRAIVETAKYLEDNPDPGTGLPTLQLAAAFTGFNREDGRSWIDFHDGVSNLRSGQERLDAIEVKPQATAADKWTEGGTYMTFLRLSVDLKTWRRMTQQQQELIVGRSKISGCPITDIDASGLPLAAAACPFTGTHSVFDPGNEEFREPAGNVPAGVLLSHVQRANHHIGPIDRDVSERFYRQGFEFLEPPQPGRELVVGLNFVSFQDTLKRIFFVLTTPTWLGLTNFGGDPLSGPRLLRVLAAGVFFCPSVVSGEPYPGSSMFA